VRACSCLGTRLLTAAVCRAHSEFSGWRRWESRPMWALDHSVLMWRCTAKRRVGPGVGVVLGPAQGGRRGRRTSGRVSRAEGAVAS
jgi:hypothetical protein